MVKGISVANPVRIEQSYVEKTVDYAIEKGYNHFQFIGPIHDYELGNIDGMTFSVKYQKYNKDRNADYVNLNLKVVNEALEKLSSHGIKSYMWHHELDLPTDFITDHPEMLNTDGDIEITHPLVKDYLENRIKDFFDAYPKMDGIILTLHETKVPLLKLKNQKLDKIGRVKYVTEILFNSCKKYGKELVVRPFASVQEDYENMLKAYESISKDLVVMDKWTQFDWSLTLPHNQFFKQIKNNPLLVETDIFGEYFGKGRLPVMLKNHIVDKFEYCNKYNTIGYANRIDREGYDPFGTVNEVNLYIANALMNGENVDQAIDTFFAENYPECDKELQDIMSYTEDLNKKLLNTLGYYFSEGSFFPELNHSKNHFYFEMMKKSCNIASNEWFIPKNWVRTSVEDIFAEKDYVLKTATELLQRVKKLKSKMTADRFSSLLTHFENLYYGAWASRTLLDVFYNYVKYFEDKNEENEKALYIALDKLLVIDSEGRKVVGETSDYYLNNNMFYKGVIGAGSVIHIVEIFVDEVKQSFEFEKKRYFELLDKDYTDFIVCGGGAESHKLQKEVNFSDTMIIDGEICRIPGNRRGASWSQINAHGWFSYELCVKPNQTNEIVIEAGSLTGSVDFKLTENNVEHIVCEKVGEKEKKIFKFNVNETCGENSLRIRIDRTSGNTPLIYSIIVK